MLNRSKVFHIDDAYDVLFAASTIGNLDIVKEIFERYKYVIDVNISDEMDNTPLHIAAIYNNVDVAEYLISKGAGIDLKNNHGKTPLHLAIQVDEIKISSFLLTHGAKVDIKDINGMTPLHMAVIRKFYDMAKLLIHHHANINIKNSKGKSPLDLAKNDEQMISILTGKASS